MKLTKFVTVVPKEDKFREMCHEMYVRFGGAYKNLAALGTTEAERVLLVAQLHELRDWVREAFEQIKELKDDK